MDGRERGFIVVHRRVRSSALYQSLTAEQRSVFYALLLLANWKDGQMRVGEVAETVARGELAHSLATIAKEAKVSIKVVRTTIAKLAVDDRAAGGRGPFLVERWIGSGPRVGTYPGTVTGTVPGTETGTGLRVLRVVNYDEYQSVTDDEGTAVGTVTGSVKGTRGARDGHDRGTNRTRVTKEPTDLFAPATPSPPSPLKALEAELAADFLAARGDKYLHGGAKDTEALKRLMSAGSADDVRRRWRLALRAEGFHRCDSFAQLAMPAHWNHFAGGSSAPQTKAAPLCAPGVR
jgi:hypothetical protein